MSDTYHLELPLIANSQSQKHVTHNEALAIVDQIIHLAVISRALATPPSSPLDGDRYLVAAGATAAWATHEGELAFFLDGAWRFATPHEGWRLWSIAEEKLFVHDGTAWRDISDIDELQDMDVLGVNTTADATNKLAVRSAAVLHTAVYVADGGSGDVQHKLNKEADGHTASFLFQKNFSGRAEIGLTGDNDFHFKVSPDGSSWVDALVLDKDDGAAAFASANGIRLNPAAGNAFTIQARPDVTTFPVVIHRPNAANKVIAYDIQPNGTPAAIGGNYAWMDVCDADLVANPSGAVRCARVAIGTASVKFGSIEFNGGASTPVQIIIDGAVMGTFNTAGFCVGSTADIVVDANRHFRRRQYAAGSLPSQDSGDEIGSSDIVAAPLVSDGTEWLSPGVKRLRTVASNTTVSIPPGWAIDQINFAETAGNAVTGGIKIGTTSGATDVVAAQPVGANSLDIIADANILKKVFSRTAVQTLHIQAVTAWNAASLELSFVLRKVF